MDFERMRRARQAQLAEDGEATAVPETTETRMRTAPTLAYSGEPEEIGTPVPGAMAVLGLTAFLISLVLTVCRLFGAPIGVLWILSPMWGSALLVLGFALYAALRMAVTDARAWVARRGL